MSSTLARYNLPWSVGTSVPSPNQRWSIRCALKSRLTWSGARQRPLPGRVVLLRRRLGRAAATTLTAFPKLVGYWGDNLQTLQGAEKAYQEKGVNMSKVSLVGFDNCVLNDMLGNVAELGTANVFLVKDGVAMTPIANGTFLNGITRQRVLGLMGREAIETVLTYKDFLAADEIFSVGNFGKVQPVTRIDDRNLQPGPVYRRARELYWDFAHSR